MLKKINQKGFTIVELLIVIVVIGILAALVISTFSGVQARARDAQRATDIKAIATQLEAYYVDSGSYPVIGNVNTTTLKGLDAGALVTPTGTGTTNLAATATPSTTQYGYVGGSCTPTTTPTQCASFVLYYRHEESNTVKSVSSLN